jgi:hypothetical protein
MKLDLRLYVSGPMSGYEDLNVKAFESAASRLREIGFSVESPHEIVPIKSMPWVECMRIDIGALMHCDAIALLDGWDRSRGATIERALGIWLGFQVFTVDEWIEAATMFVNQTKIQNGGGGEKDGRD